MLPLRAALALIGLAATLAAGGTSFRLEGEIVPPVSVAVNLQGSISPFRETTWSNAGGRFHFTHLDAGPYTLILFVAGSGEFRQTVQVGRGTADAKAVVHVRLNLDSIKPVESDKGDRFKVSVKELRIPDKATGEMRKAQDCLSRRDVKGARKHLERAVKLAPQFSEAWNTLGTIAYQSKDFVSAEKYFRQALRQDPDNYSPLVNLGGTLLSMQRAREALDYNIRAAIARPNDPLANSQLGMNYFALGKLSEGARYLRRAVELDPAHFSCPQLYLARIYEQMGNFDGAAGELEQFLKYHPDWPNAAALRAAITTLRARR